MLGNVISKIFKSIAIHPQPKGWGLLAEEEIKVAINL